MREKKGILIVVSGFSGAGKGTLMKKLMQDYDNYALSISATTRQPRVGEEDGREYFFRTKEEFEKLMEPKKMDTEKALKDVAVYCTELNKSRQEKDNISVILLKVC